MTLSCTRLSRLPCPLLTTRISGIPAYLRRYSYIIVSMLVFTILFLVLFGGANLLIFAGYKDTSIDFETGSLLEVTGLL